MIDLNIVNFITIGLISVASFAGVVALLQFLGINTAILGV